MMESEPRSFGSGSVDISQSDIRPLLRDQLERLERDITRNRARFDRVSTAHLKDIQARITAIFEMD
jgi:hypothetical protein